MIEQQPTLAGLTRRDSLTVAVGLLLASTTRAAAASADWASVNATASKLVTNRLAPGVAITMTRAGNVIYSAARGYANLETMTPVTPETVFHIGSVTKQFTGAAIALLEQDGKLGFDDRLARFLPELPRAADITLRQMLNHTAGFGNYTDRKPPEAFMISSRLDYDSKSLLADMLAHTQPLFIGEPGAGWAYSNTAYVLLGLIVEKVTGAPYARFFETRLFAPAGLTATAVDDLAQIVPHRASGYTGHLGNALMFDNAAYIAMTYPGAAGSMRSTTGDLCRWHRALLGGGIVGPKGLAAMTTPARLNGGAVPMEPVGPEPGTPKKAVDYGFGLFMDRFEGRRTVGHGGGIFGFAADLRSFPGEQLTIAILTNCDFANRPGFKPVFTLLKDGAAHAGLSG